MSFIMIKQQDNTSLTSKKYKIQQKSQVQNKTPTINKNIRTTTIRQKMRYCTNKQQSNNHHYKQIDHALDDEQQSDEYQSNQNANNYDNNNQVGYGWQEVQINDEQSNQEFQQEEEVASQYTGQQQQQQQEQQQQEYYQQFSHQPQQQGYKHQKNNNQQQRINQHYNDIDYEQYDVDQLMRELVLFMRDKQVRANMRFDMSQRISKILDVVKQSKQKKSIIKQQSSNNNNNGDRISSSKFNELKQKQLKLLKFNNNQQHKKQQQQLKNQDEIIIDQLQNNEQRDRLFKTGNQSTQLCNIKAQNNNYEQQNSYKISKSKSSQNLGKVSYTKLPDNNTKQQHKPLNSTNVLKPSNSNSNSNLNFNKNISKGGKVKASIICYNPPANSDKQNRSSSKWKTINRHKTENNFLRISGVSSNKKQRFNTEQSSTIQKSSNLVDTGRMNVTAFTVRSSYNKNNNTNAKQHVLTNSKQKNKSKSKDHFAKTKYNTTAQNNIAVKVINEQQQRNWSSKPVAKINMKSIKANSNQSTKGNQIKSTKKVGNNGCTQNLTRSKSKDRINNNNLVQSLNNIQKTQGNIRRVHTQHIQIDQQAKPIYLISEPDQCFRPVSHLPSTHFAKSKQKSQTQLTLKNNVCSQQSKLSQQYSNPGSTSGSLNATALMNCYPVQLASFPFLQRIQSLLSMQENANKTVIELESQIKRLKGLLASQKLALQQSIQSSNSIRQQLVTTESNRSSAQHKAQQSRIKANNISTELKFLQQSIQQTKQRNEETVGLVAEERQLIDMYNTVIEEVKGQYKIQVQARDQIKRALIREKKSQGVSRIKADSKERLNTSILTNLRDSLQKWDI